MNNWKPEEETNNEYLVKLEKNYASAKFIFTLYEDFSCKLNIDTEVVKKWKTLSSNIQPSCDDVVGQCSITGENNSVIARVHDNLSGIAGGQATGMNLVCFKESS